MCYYGYGSVLNQKYGFGFYLDFLVVFFFKKLSQRNTNKKNYQNALVKHMPIATSGKSESLEGNSSFFAPHKNKQNNRCPDYLRQKAS